MYRNSHCFSKSIEHGLRKKNECTQRTLDACELFVLFYRILCYSHTVVNMSLRS